VVGIVHEVIVIKGELEVEVEVEVEMGERRGHQDRN
jgi:hypothetical protein